VSQRAARERVLAASRAVFASAAAAIVLPEKVATWAAGTDP